jgi:transposase
MVSQRKRFTRDFKLETVKLVTSSDLSVAEVAEDLGIHPNTIYKWVRKFGEKQEAIMSGEREQLSEAEQLRLVKRENQRLRMERDILKKAMAIFSKEPK